MEVETYELQETEVPVSEEEKEEYTKLTEDLGLEGMGELLDREGVIPFQRLDSAQKNIWNAFAPSEHRLKDYRESIIPLRVLALCKLGIDEEYFDEVRIWSESEVDPDPIAVGLVFRDGNQYSIEAYYLIARWGEALRSWEEVVRIAREKLTRKAEVELKARLSRLKAALDGQVPEAVEDIINGRTDSFPYDWRK
jgi:hypothetical protein